MIHSINNKMQDTKTTSSISQRHQWLIDALLLVLLLGLIIAVTTLYISQERAIYFWDLSNYHDQTSDLVFLLRQSPQEAIKAFLESLNSDYNKFSCLPLIPFVWFFGESRLVYVLSCAIVYVFPFCLVMGMIATEIILGHSRAVFWSAAFLTLLMPSTWIALLRGYPDLGGALIMGLAIVVYLKDIYLKKWWQIPLIGFLLVLSILFRRHFAYSARGFFIAIACQFLILLIIDFRNNFDFKKIVNKGINQSILLVLLFLSIFISLLIIYPQFLQKVLKNNYRELYLSYESPISHLISWLKGGWGSGIWILTILGYLGAIVSHVASRSKILFIILFGSISLGQWLVSSKQIGLHYLNHFNFLIIIGLTTFLWTITIWTKNSHKIRLLSVGFCLAFLWINLAFVLSPISFNKLGIAQGGLGDKTPPLIRSDYHEITRLIELLRKITKAQEPIYIAASSNISFNDSLVIEAEKQLYGRNKQILTIAQSPNIDSRDFYPLNPLLESQYVVVAEPFQHHLPPQEQEVVKFVVDAFLENWPIAQDFKRLPQEFILDNQGEKVTVHIYQRIRPTSLPVTLQTLKSMTEKIQPEPGAETEWLLSDKEPNMFIFKTPENTVTFNANSVPKSSLMYIKPLSNTVKVTGEVQMQDSQPGSCAGLSVQLSTLDEQGKSINETTTYLPKDSQPLSIFIPNNQGMYLKLDLVAKNEQNQQGSCSIQIQKLQVSDSK